MDYLEHKVTKDDLKKIFKSNVDRYIFISLYEYFGIDGNDDYYTIFIDEYIGKQRLLAQIDAVELSIVSGIFKPTYLSKVKGIIYGRKKPEAKLVCLDWLFEYSEYLPEMEYLELQSYTIQKNESDLLKFQAMMNVLLVKSNEQTVCEILRFLEQSENPRIFYRFISNLNEKNLHLKFEIHQIEQVISFCEGKNFKEAQKVGLSNELKQLLAIIG